MAVAGADVAGQRHTRATRGPHAAARGRTRYEHVDCQSAVCRSEAPDRLALFFTTMQQPVLEAPLDFNIWQVMGQFPLAHVPGGAPGRNATGAASVFGCGNAEGWGPILRRYYDFTPCFLSVLSAAAAAFMIVGGVYQIGRLRRHKQAANRIEWLYWLKMALVAAQMVFVVALVRSPVVVTGWNVLAAAWALNVAAVAVAWALHYVEQHMLTIPNGVLLFFWLFELLLGALKIANLHIRRRPRADALVVLQFANAVLVLVLELWCPQQPRRAAANESPYDRAHVFSRITFNWMAPLMKRGYRHFLTERDLPALPHELRLKEIGLVFNRHWRNQCAHSAHPSLVGAIARTVAVQFLASGAFKLIQDSLAFVQPQLLRMLIRFVTEYLELEAVPLTKGFMIAFAMFAVSVTQTAALHQYFQRAFDNGMKIKSSLIGRIYQKAIVLSNEAKQESNTGDIVNLMSVDTQRLQDLFQNLTMIWLGPFQIVLCLVLLHGVLGPSMWAGVAIMVVMIPLNAAIAKYQKKLQKLQMGFKDERSRLISEILNNIKSLKLYGWEQPYLKKLNHVRNDKELKNLRRMGVFLAVSTFLWSFAPFLVSCLTFAVFLLYETDRTLSTDIVFTSLSLFNLLSFPLAMFPVTITNIVEAQVAISRLSKFLTATELQPDAVQRTHGEGGSVSIASGTFLWTKASGEENYKVALLQINLAVGKLLLDCIVGKVGLGKSLIIQAILGDLYRLEGEVRVNGSVAYVLQVPWIMNGTVRENILFGHKYDPEFYATVLQACALAVDLKILPRGDKTEVGEKGISLLGGQKARLSLARAVYARADVYLLDDPLLAVDEHVGRHLIDNVLGPQGLLKGKCKILATNNIGVLSIADNIHMISEGRFVEQGSYHEIMRKSTKLQLKQLIEEYGRKKEEEEKDTEKEEAVPPQSDDASDGIEEFGGEGVAKAACNDDRRSLRRASLVPLGDDDDGDDDDDDSQSVSSRREHVEQGKVKWDVYLQYARACNPSSVLLYLVFATLTIATTVLLSIWLKHWSEVNSEHGYNPRIAYYLGVYFGIGLTSLAINLGQNCIMWIFCTIHGLRKLHNNMAVSVLRAPMSFFETTPIGRVLNRFSNDIYKVDEVLGRVFGMFFANLIRVLFTMAVICFSTWQFVFMLIPIGVLYVYYQQYYLKTSRELRRLDSVSRSPIFANFQESLNGVSIIRAYGQQQRFSHLNDVRIDRNMSAYHPAINANRWLAVRLEFLGSLIILGAAGLSIWTLRSGHLSAGMVGLSVLYSLQITQTLNWIVRMTVEVETNIVSVERILEYLQLTPEAPDVIENHRPTKDWPQNGEVAFKNYSAKYRPELDLVLKNINLTIKPHEKVGIVGRTGAGKLSLTLALFRIIESFEGHIDIDALNTSTIGLADLRHRLSIIPQDSQVFEGTIRSNLDPTGVYSDEQMWKALELSHLKQHVLQMAGDVADALDARLSEGGSNLSVGQRQLMCLARSILIPSHILVLDEATAAVDVETDKLLQQTIRREFKDRTIMTIAHRLNTIMDSDRIIVLENGQVAEFDTPQNLLKRKNSLFYGLCLEGGVIQDDKP